MLFHQKVKTSVAVPLGGVNVDCKWTHFSEVGKHCILFLVLVENVEINKVKKGFYGCRYIE